MSTEEYKNKIGLPEGHRLVETEPGSWSVRKGQDTDISYYDHVDENGLVVAKYKIIDSTSTYPPFGRSITCEKIG